MKKVFTSSIIGAVALMASAGVALANEGGIQINGESHLKVMGGDMDMNDHARGNAGGIHIEATSVIDHKMDVSERGEKDGDKWENRSSSTSAKSHGEDRDDNEHGSTTRGDNEGHGWGKGGISGFFRMIFGLPASTTIGEIRTEMTATTTANTSHSNGLGFWARLFGAFSSR